MKYGSTNGKMGKMSGRTHSPRSSVGNMHGPMSPQTKTAASKVKVPKAGWLARDKNYRGSTGEKA